MDRESALRIAENQIETRAQLLMDVGGLKASVKTVKEQDERQWEAIAQLEEKTTVLEHKDKTHEKNLDQFMERCADFLDDATWERELRKKVRMNWRPVLIFGTFLALLLSGSSLLSAAKAVLDMMK